MLEHFLRSAVLDNVATVHKADSVCYLCRKAHFVCDNYHCHSCLSQVFHNVQNFANELRVKGGSRLVKEYDLGLHCKGPRNSHTLLLTA